ncbi:hypothetical protein ACFIQF_07080 [Comamonas sp. J-3]|uniref:hypothetical protein n=1 Tax=Comamonas trifloxystrobinivorans TaxID=3350256 RepID=UPI0037271CDA
MTATPPQPHNNAPAPASADEKALHELRHRSITLALIGMTGLFLVFVLGDLMARAHYAWMQATSAYLFWFGVVLLVFYVVAYIGHSPLSKMVGGQWSSQAALAVFVWFMYTQASMQAGILLNSVYGVDPSVFSSSSQILTFVQMFILSRPLMVIAVLWSLVHVLRYVRQNRHQRSPVSKLKAAIMLSGALIGLLSLLFIHLRFSDDLMAKKSYLIAKEQDFNPRVRCGNADVPGIGLFLGPMQNRVLMDNTPSTMSWTASIYATREDLAQLQLPKDFRILDCPAPAAPTTPMAPASAG